MTPVPHSHISALFTALCGLSLSKVSNLVPNLHELSLSFQAHISKHTRLILEPKSTFKSSHKKKWIILKIFNYHNRRSHQTTQVQLLECSLGTWWSIKPEVTFLVIKYVLVKHVLYLTSLPFFTYPSPHTHSPHWIMRNSTSQISDSNNQRITEWFGLNRTLKSPSFQPSLLWAGTHSSRPNCSGCTQSLLFMSLMKTFKASWFAQGLQQ